MGFLFWKSAEERRIEREMQVRKGLALLDRQAKSLESDIGDYKKMAADAKRIGSGQQLDVLKAQIRKTLGQLRVCQQQSLTLRMAHKTAQQVQNHREFAKSLQAVSRAISEAFGKTDLVATQRDFEKGIAQAESMQQRMELFLDSTMSAMSQVGDADKLVSDAEVDRMIDDTAVTAEKSDLDKRIDAGIDEVRKELGR